MRSKLNRYDAAFLFGCGIELAYKIQHGFAAQILDSTRHKAAGNVLPLLLHVFYKHAGIAGGVFLGRLVGLGKYGVEGHAPFAQLPQKRLIGILGLMTGINQYEYRHQVFPGGEVSANHFFPLGPCRHRHFGEAVSGEVYKIKGIVDEEVVDHLGLTRRARCFGQAGVAGQHIDERRLADIGTANERILRFIGLGAERYVGTADNVLG
jgi:hypothetical protein